MAKATAQALDIQGRTSEWLRQGALVVGASLVVALCARVTIPLPFTPVPLTMENFAVLLVGLTLGSRRGFAALMLFLLEGASGMPVFSAGSSGVAQLFGVTGGFLLAYPFVAAIAGWIAERGAKNFFRFIVASVAGEIVLFAGGISWLAIYTHSLTQAVRFGLYWFVFAEVIKIMLAAGSASGWNRARKSRA
jgi:biotin transport system substrate-specific component